MKSKLDELASAARIHLPNNEDALKALRGPPSKLVAAERVLEEVSSVQADVDAHWKGLTYHRGQVELLLFDANRLRAESDSAYVKAGLDSERLQQCRKYREDMKALARGIEEVEWEANRRVSSHTVDGEHGSVLAVYIHSLLSLREERLAQMDGLLGEAQDTLDAVRFRSSRASTGKLVPSGPSAVGRPTPSRSLMSLASTPAQGSSSQRYQELQDQSLASPSPAGGGKEGVAATKARLLSLFPAASADVVHKLPEHKFPAVPSAARPGPHTVQAQRIAEEAVLKSLSTVATGPVVAVPAPAFVPASGPGGSATVGAPVGVAGAGAGPASTASFTPPVALGGASGGGGGAATGGLASAPFSFAASMPPKPGSGGTSTSGGGASGTAGSSGSSGSSGSVSRQQSKRTATSQEGTAGSAAATEPAVPTASGAGGSAATPPAFSFGGGGGGGLSFGLGVPKATATATPSGDAPSASSGAPTTLGSAATSVAAPVSSTTSAASATTSPVLTRGLTSLPSMASLSVGLPATSGTATSAADSAATASSVGASPPAVALGSVFTTAGTSTPTQAAATDSSTVTSSAAAPAAVTPATATATAAPAVSSPGAGTSGGVSSDELHIAQLKAFYTKLKPENVPKAEEHFKKYKVGIWAALHKRYGDATLEFTKDLVFPPGVSAVSTPKPAPSAAAATAGVAAPIAATSVPSAAGVATAAPASAAPVVAPVVSAPLAPTSLSSVFGASSLTAPTTAASTAAAPFSTGGLFSSLGLGGTSTSSAATATPSASAPAPFSFGSSVFGSAAAGPTATASSPAPSGELTQAERDAHVHQLSLFYAQYNAKNTNKAGQFFEKYGTRIWESLEAKPEYKGKTAPFTQSLRFPAAGPATGPAPGAGALAPSSTLSPFGAAPAGASSARSIFGSAMAASSLPSTGLGFGASGGTGGLFGGAAPSAPAPALGAPAGGLTVEQAHVEQLRQFFSGQPDKVNNAQALFSKYGTRIWEQLEKKYPGRTAAHTQALATRLASMGGGAPAPAASSSVFGAAAAPSAVFGAGPTVFGAPAAAPSAPAATFGSNFGTQWSAPPAPGFGAAAPGASSIFGAAAATAAPPASTIQFGGGGGGAPFGSTFGSPPAPGGMFASGPPSFATQPAAGGAPGGGLFGSGGVFASRNPWAK